MTPLFNAMLINYEWLQLLQRFSIWETGFVPFNILIEPLQVRYTMWLCATEELSYIDSYKMYIYKII